jgi:two-component system response regulator LytT
MSAPLLKTIIVDDERLARRELRRLLKAVEDVEITAEAGNGIEADAIIAKERPDLVFLDIEMPGLNGLQVAEKMLQKKNQAHVIFVTAYDHYAIKAFEVNAVDYLLKPIVPERLEESVERVRKLIAAGASPLKNLEQLVASLSAPKNRKLSLRFEKSSIIIDAADLIFAHAEQGVVTAVTAATTGTLACQSLDELHEMLGDSFFRAHRGYVVNIDKIREVIPWFSGTFRLRMSNNSEIPLSRNRAKALRDILDF